MATTIIVGGVAGGMSTAARLRRRSEDMEIIVFEASGHVSFANCGLPYYVGGTIAERDALLLQNPESLRARFNIDVRVNHRVTAINTEAQTVTVEHAGVTSTHHYDHLVLSPGARPIVPDMPGKERLLTLRTVEDVDSIVAALDLEGADPVTSAAIIGGGFIGVELAENLKDRGLNVTIIERAPHILGIADQEIVGVMMQNLRDNGINIITNANATEITADEVLLADGTRVPASIVIAAIGVIPETDLARDAGIALGERGGIQVDDQLRTSAPNVFALGDASEKRDFNTDAAALVPLAQTANRHGRLVADIITGRDTARLATQGTAIIGAFGVALAVTGWSERRARAAGRAIRIVHVHPASHAGYYPGSAPVHLKLIIDAETDKILGAQAVGRDGVDKRIDVIATAMRAGLTASDLADLELAYSPQYGSAKDAVNIAGMVADNQLTGENTVHWHELADITAAAGTEGAVGAAGGSAAHLVDVRSPAEHAAGTIPGAVNIPVDTMRDVLAKNPDAIAPDAVVFCQVGLRGHVATTLLRGHGVKVRNLSGGYVTWSHAQQGT
ncbi:FAD-dependent oxidoreductase [Leucobacter sp. OH1287]|uniref:FAD-dependent oxidoreductase n=1 Tax=Leucobacter sp. OH1287 TaxID=2491049 RepID=UPI000F5ED77E|nr:FAD-dependent oxidoreductase [Leucobacter sp. OH1287]RRD61529.1 CoA-disulfide reductase [Leucobacter sp. OH1287]